MYLFALTVAFATGVVYVFRYGGLLCRLCYTKEDIARGYIESGCPIYGHRDYTALMDRHRRDACYSCFVEDEFTCCTCPSCLSRVHQNVDNNGGTIH